MLGLFLMMIDDQKTNPDSQKVEIRSPF